MNRSFPLGNYEESDDEISYGDINIEELPVLKKRALSDSNNDDPSPLPVNGNDESHFAASNVPSDATHSDSVQSDSVKSDCGPLPGLLDRKKDNMFSSLAEIETENRRFNNAARPADENDDAHSDNISMPSLCDKFDSNSDDSSSGSDVPPLRERYPDSESDSSSDASDKLSSDVESCSVGKSESDGERSDGENSDIDDMPTLVKNKYRDDMKAPQARDLTVTEEKKRFAKIRAETGKKRKNASSIIAALYRGYAVRQEIKKTARGFTILQAITRGIMNRRLRAKETEHIRQFREFRNVWANSLQLVKGIKPDELDWASLKDKQDYIRREEFNDIDEMKETDEKLTDAMTAAMQGLNDRNIDQEFDVKEIVREGASNGGSNKRRSSAPAPVLKRIHLSGDVVKWLRQGDRKYRDFFIRRMKQLATGESSRILQKRLFGSENTIYETYLEQKSGFRILWTEKDDYLLVWYVAKHKSVSRLMKLIDDSKRRSEKTRISITEIEELKHIGGGSNIEEKQGHEVFLDPLGNVPLKVYNISTDEIDDILEENWTPNLHLTDEERDVVETRGTVLLLGRSGTGEDGLAIYFSS